MNSIFSRLWLGTSTLSRDDEYPPGATLEMILWGVLLAVFPISLAAIGLYNGNAPWPLRGTRFDFDGSLNIATCIGFIALGVYAHFHYFWGILRVRSAFVYGRKAALLCIVGCAGYVIIAIVRSFMTLADAF
ncbi:MAG: hypothetical protein R3F19_32745 [Verrucomicrobiales bacterium]